MIFGRNPVISSGYIVPLKEMPTVFIFASTLTFQHSTTTFTKVRFVIHKTSQEKIHFVLGIQRLIERLK